jgi:putative phosphotransacetylase
MRPDADLIKRIAEEVANRLENTPYVKVGVSNRHIHISRPDLDALFGENYSLTPIKELLPGQYACEETVSIIGAKGKISRVRILGPIRRETQLEISLTDGFALGVQAPVNESGNLEGAGTVLVENPANGAKIERKCAITALRHIHLTPEFARAHKLRDKQTVSVEFDGTRPLILGGVLIRVSSDFRDEMHIDTDEANAASAKNGDYGRIIA